MRRSSGGGMMRRCTNLAMVCCAPLPSAPRCGGLRRVVGDTLIEVMAALLLLALAALGMVALQSWVAKSQQSARWLDIAVSAAAIAAEALRAGLSANTSAALANRSAADLPDGRARLIALPNGQWRIIVGWTEAPRWVGRGTDAAGHDGGAACSAVASRRTAQGTRVSRCVSLELVR